MALIVPVVCRSDPANVESVLMGHWKLAFSEKIH